MVCVYSKARVLGKVAQGLTCGSCRCMCTECGSPSAEGGSQPREESQVCWDYRDRLVTYINYQFRLYSVLYLFHLNNYLWNFGRNLCAFLGKLFSRQESQFPCYDVTELWKAPWRARQLEIQPCGSVFVGSYSQFCSLDWVSPLRLLRTHRSPLRMGWGFHRLLELGSKFTLRCLGKVAAGLQPVG